MLQECRAAISLPLFTKELSEGAVMTVYSVGQIQTPKDLFPREFEENILSIADTDLIRRIPSSPITCFGIQPTATFMTRIVAGAF